jgi:hypothetical protein
MITLGLIADYSSAIVEKAIAEVASSLGWFCLKEETEFRLLPKRRMLEVTGISFVLRPKEGIAHGESLTVKLGPIQVNGRCHEFGVSLDAKSGQGEKAFDSPGVQVPVCDLLEAIQKKLTEGTWGDDRD